LLVPAAKIYTIASLGIIFACFVVIGVFFTNSSKVEGRLKLEPIMLDKIGNKYGLPAKQRFVDWQKLMDEDGAIQEKDKLQQVNDFFNRNIKFADDMVVWAKNDYWATPVELLAKGAGDCEDFSIAKYFTLLELGVDQSKLRITYVKVLTLNISHMVLTYFESPQAVPLVLDNLNPNITPATERNDLVPVYSFNGDGLWLAKMNGNNQPVGSAYRLDMWADLKKRMLELPL
jgi:predicted transglutaminase-like cysteine proteinase